MADIVERVYRSLLVVRCQAGDEMAFAELVERYQPRLRFYLCKMPYGVREPDAAAASTMAPDRLSSTYDVSRIM